MTPAAPVEAARALAPGVRAAADATERGRRVPLELVRELAEAGLFRLCVPRSLGGLEADVATLATAVEEVARADGSAGWIVAIGATSGLVAGYLPPDAAREIYGRDPLAVTGGVFAPRGTAQREGGGWRVTGRWPFASGCEHCAWLMGGCLPADEKPGAPFPRMMLFPAAEATIHDTWNVAGLRGTGSHDIAVDGVLVPLERSVSLTGDRPVASGALYAFPAFGLLAVGIAAVTLGIARAAIDDLVALSGAKTPTGSRRVLAARPATQSAVAEAEAALRSARAYFHDAIGAAWRTAAAEGAMSIADRVELRLAATHATRSAARVVDAMYEAGGGTSVYVSCPLERRFRDVHVATQHLMVSPATFELAGRVLLGQDADTSML